MLQCHCCNTHTHRTVYSIWLNVSALPVTLYSQRATWPADLQLAHLLFFGSHSNPWRGARPVWPHIPLHVRLAVKNTHQHWSPGTNMFLPKDSEPQQPPPSRLASVSSSCHQDWSKGDMCAMQWVHTVMSSSRWIEEMLAIIWVFNKRHHVIGPII